LSNITTIFVVEDDLSLQRLYSEILSLHGFHVVGAAKNGKEAVEIFKTFSEKPDIILMDHRMPVKNGIQATKEILQYGDQSKIIFISADISIREKALSIGAIHFIEKPFTYDQLVDHIKKVLLI